MKNIFIIGFILLVISTIRSQNSQVKTLLSTQLLDTSFVITPAKWIEFSFLPYSKIYEQFEKIDSACISIWLGNKKDLDIFSSQYNLDQKNDPLLKPELHWMQTAPQPKLNKPGSTQLILHKNPGVKKKGLDLISKSVSLEKNVLALIRSDQLCFFQNQIALDKVLIKSDPSTIQNVSIYLKQNKKDFSSLKVYLTVVGKRKNLQGSSEHKLFFEKLVQGLDDISFSNAHSLWISKNANVFLNADCNFFPWVVKAFDLQAQKSVEGQTVVDPQILEQLALGSQKQKKSSFMQLMELILGNQNQKNDEKWSLIYQNFKKECLIKQ